MDVIVMKMNNGDEVIAELKSETPKGDGIIVSRPRVIFHDGRQGGLAPYFISSPNQENITIANDRYIARFQASIELADGYRKSSSSLQLVG